LKSSVILSHLSFYCLNKDRRSYIYWWRNNFK